MVGYPGDSLVMGGLAMVGVYFTAGVVLVIVFGWHRKDKATRFRADRPTLIPDILDRRVDGPVQVRVLRCSQEDGWYRGLVGLTLADSPPYPAPLADHVVSETRQVHYLEVWAQNVQTRKRHIFVIEAADVEVLEGNPASGQALAPGLKNRGR